MGISIIVGNYVKFTLNGSSLFLDWKDPTLLMVENHDSSYPADYNVLSLNGTSTTVRDLYLIDTDGSGNTSSFNLKESSHSIIL